VIGMETTGTCKPEVRAKLVARSTGERLRASH
jgi:hypothetical protein